MKRHRRSLQFSINKLKSNLNTKEKDKKKYRNSIQNLYSKKNIEKKDKEDNILSKAYKNVLNVITNLLDNIEDEKSNGKMNSLGTYRRNQNFNKKPVKKLESYDNPHIRFSLNYHDSSLTNSSFDIQKAHYNSYLRNKFTYNSNNLKRKNYPNLNDDSEFYYSELNNMKGIQQSKLKKLNFSNNSNFRPKSKFRNFSTKNIKSGILCDEKITETFVNKNSVILNEKSINKLNSSISSFSSKNKKISGKLKKNIKKRFTSSSKDQSSCKSNLTYSNYSSNITKYLEEKLKKNQQKNSEHNSSSSNKDEQKNRDINNEDYSDNLNNSKNLEYKNENKSFEQLLNFKGKRRIRKSLSTELKYYKINSFKSKKIDSKKTFPQEKNYRLLLYKGNVYDSLDDEEINDDEDINNFYLEPNSLFLYILDAITLISSLIILFYLPIFLAKKLYFCRNLNDINTIIFYSIDIIYIFDLIINFYRAYYNFDEILIKKNILICLHYLKTWFIFDMISSIPVYTILNSKESKCINKNNYYDNKLNNNGIHSIHYNVNLNNIHYIFLFLKVIKTFKIFKKNIAMEKILSFFNENDYFSRWGDVFSYTFYFFSFLNISSCIFIFIGRNIIESWIFLDGLETKSFIDIYIGAVYYFVMTVTTVGYGDVIGKSIIEILFQVIMVIAGTCIYSWLISSISNYVKKINEKDLKYEEKIQLLEEIKLNNPNFTEKLYNKISRLLTYRKYHEEEIEKSIILESLPNSLKHTLIIEMYKEYINGFSFFRGVENREFMVGIISKLMPMVGVKGDILIQEGEYIEEIIFIKNGVLSLEIWIDMSDPEDSIENYLNDHGFINSEKRISKNHSFFNSSIKNQKNSYISKITNTVLNNYFEKIENKNEKASNENNKKKIKLLDFRKNEHFGDVFMFLNKKSPLYVKVNSRKADLLLLRKLDAINISNRFPDIWKTIIKKPLENSKMISNLTIKMLTTFCNLNGIKTKLFKKKKTNKNFPQYYLKPNINRAASYKIKKNKTIKLNNKNEKYQIRNNTIKEENYEEKITKSLTKSSLEKISNNYFNESNKMDSKKYDKKKKNILFRNTTFSFKKKQFHDNFDAFSFKNSNKNINIYPNDNKYNRISSKLLKNKKSSFKNSKSPYESIMSKSQESEKQINQHENISENKSNKNIHLIQKNNNDINNSNNKDNFNKKLSNKDFDLECINDEINSGENFSLHLYESEKQNTINNNITKVKNIIKDNKYINKFNIIGINYLGIPLENNQNGNNKLLEKPKFKNLKISSISKFEISSSYENINEITSSQYINNNMLKTETKKFLLEICKTLDNKTSRSPILFNRKIIGSNPNILDINHINSKLSLKSSMRNTSDNSKTKKIIRTKTIKNNEINNNVNNIEKDLMNYFNKSEKTINNKIQKKITSKSFINNSIKANCSDLEKQISDGTYENDRLIRNSLNKRSIGSLVKDNNCSNKKKKKQKEIDIISFNIRKSSQNLNQPDIFYAGLFNELMVNYRNKSSCKITNIIKNNEEKKDKNMEEINRKCSQFLRTEKNND